MAKNYENENKAKNYSTDKTSDKNAMDSRNSSKNSSKNSFTGIKLLYWEMQLFSLYLFSGKKQARSFRAARRGTRRARTGLGMAIYQGSWICARFNACRRARHSGGDRRMATAPLKREAGIFKGRAAAAVAAVRPPISSPS